MEFGSLFAGIGGIDLGLERAGMKCIWQIEKDEFCQKVLQKHWPDIPKYGDIYEVRGDELGAVELIAGGFPCQPFSLAGKREGEKDGRYLWPEMLRIIENISPEWVIAENVGGIFSIDGGNTINAICASLETIGYEKPAIFDFAADTFGLSTMERHIWIVAKADGKRRKRGEKKKDTEAWQKKGEFQGTHQGECDRSDLSKTRFCRVSERVSDRVDRDRLKALGNAVIPQMAEWIGRRIMEFEAIT
ncbi:DNA (cytosine-5-)-methyltransferase [Iocasia frigidifontis]|uniref:Cytosine-specific methyltransferase n=1 Tax=Iocasia fonsfrigidae TaxID=2682810 RepID=A0A8A7K5F5_9FIRM|nr:DNA (cytosine-5-)-methyltransferase [Iocasia fonsfrigidae]QTL96541.1 DNA (cytosine-5-)-methyltransferase [Iocasia fonsfrigidae]